ncbi:MAG: S1/P1 nuclease [Acidobacteriota bacterium]
MLGSLGLLLLAVLPGTATAWSSTGHMIIAQIAYDELSPPARAEADRLILRLAAADPPTADFVPASVWMDGERQLGFRGHDRWHYINLPINADGLRAVKPAAEDNVVAAIRSMERTLQNPEAGDFQRALALRYLLHMVGDVHQPVHCVARFTLELPEGDRGANDFQIFGDEQSTAGATNLHAYWDRTLGIFPWVEADGSWAEEIPRFAAVTLKQVPRSLEPVAIEDPEVWAREGFHLAKEFVYRGIESGGTPSEEYRRRAEPVIYRQLALGGWRLAVLLESALLDGKASPSLATDSPAGSGAR